jgi:hypothetical protein
VDCREGLGLVGSFHKRKATFWATLVRHRRRRTAPPLAKDASVAMQQRPHTERARHVFSADCGRNSRPHVVYVLGVALIDSLFRFSLTTGVASACQHQSLYFVQQFGGGTV